MNILTVTNAEGVPASEGIVGAMEGRQLCWRTQAEDRLLCLAQLDLKGGSPLKTLKTLQSEVDFPAYYPY